MIERLQMLPHIEGGYCVRRTGTRASCRTVPSRSRLGGSLGSQRRRYDAAFRSASTTIFYLVTPGSPQGNFSPQSCAHGTYACTGVAGCTS